MFMKTKLIKNIDPHFIAKYPEAILHLKDVY